MAASRHTPRVPRVSQGPDGASSAGGSSDGEPGRVSVGPGAKVTLLGAPGTGTTGSGSTGGSQGASGHGSGGTGERAPDGGPGEDTARERPAGEVLAFPEPPHRRRRRRAAIAAGIAAALVAGLLAVVLFTPLVAVRTITVQGTRLLTPAQVEGVLEPVRGRPLARVGDDEVLALLGQLVQVKDARVRVEPPETLVVAVIERVPVALVKQEDGLLVVDGEGVVLGTAADEEQYDVPVIDGASVPVGQEVFHAVTAVLSALPAEVLAQLATASAESADSVQLKLADGRTVVWGNAQERELKSRVLQALVKAADAAPPGQAPVRVFDVSVPRHPVTR
ncbi:cell division protein FtsQ/DivIB [Sinomonas mesophila]|uniref:cell division protein FtsQ/DivIB n=1 Tax=Sinomonas mesophila TaxID=1531955 RepID=UPI001FE8AD62|nr:cell division protein FtsQ/DivIB [Sinomonas mesophila]